MLKKINIIKDGPSPIDIYKLIEDNFKEMNKKIDNMNKKIDFNSEKLEEITLKLKSIKNYKVKCGEEYRRDVKEQKFIIGKDFSKEKVLSNLSLRSVNGDINLIKHYYLLEDKKSIELMNQRRFEFWNEGRWHIDMDGHKIANIISKNLQKLYTSVNTISEIESYAFLQNQVHINRLCSDRYKKQLIRKLKVEI